MFDPLPLPQEMARWDAMSIAEYGVKNEMLMENASREALAVLLAEWGEVAVEGQRVLLFAGPGNNGGDAICLARHLHDLGARALVLHMGPKSRYSGVSRYHLRLAQRVGVEMKLFSPGFSCFEFQPDCVVDGLLGTGFSGELRPQYIEAVQTINALAKNTRVLALDCPTGLCGRTGRPLPVAVQAYATVTFAAPKLGMVLPPAQPYLGKLHVRPIGIPKAVFKQAPSRHALLNKLGLRRTLAADEASRSAMGAILTPFSPQLHKGTTGKVLVVGGSPGLTGAPLLAALGALRGGAGLVTVACPGGLAQEVKAATPEVMTLAMGSGQDWNTGVAPVLAKRIHEWDAVALGPGLGRAEGSGEFLAAFLAALPADRPGLLLDADALYWLAKNPGLKEYLRPEDILTPHPGEAALLLDPQQPDTASVQNERSEAAQHLADQFGCVAVLKGAGTLIAALETDDRPNQLLLCPIDAPTLAVGGAGDVLAGLVAGLAARKLPARHAAALGVFLHARAGQILENTYLQRGNMARDISRALPRALKEFTHDSTRPRHHDP
ncbi:MAG: NAD(P)H-hydrate dehydratase [Desulfovibrio sp.]|nr:MAG: NAD(P)H-hydrate dehydratase [Desulfovibrio sp.]